MSNYPKLTLLTEPVNDAGKRYGGHYAVTRSLVEGLQKIDAHFNYNPGDMAEVGETVAVLSGIETLMEAIDWKNKGYINKLLAGPNLMTVRTKGFREIFSSPALDICLVPSDWVRIAYEETAPALKGRIRCWYAGVDENYWKPEIRSTNENTVLVYWKTEPADFNGQVERILLKHGWNPVRVVYGSYTAAQFKNVLAKSVFAVFLSKSESQGLALAEAWSMDVPTLVWSPRELVIETRQYAVFSACPYLCDLTGMQWTTTGELEQLLEALPAKLVACKPRKWVLENMTDTIAAKIFLDIKNEKMDNSH
ncbi:MAG: hypothetical protein AB1767_04275 [Bacillota bacterium]